MPGLADPVLGERSLVPTSAKAPEPNDDLHGDRLTLPRAHDRPSEKTCLAVLVGRRGRRNIAGPTTSVESLCQRAKRRHAVPPHLLATKTKSGQPG